MATSAPDILVRRGIDRGLIGTILMSALLHAAVLGLLIAVPAQFLRAPDRVDSYTVDLVAPDVLGGTQLVPGGGKAAAPVDQPDPAPVSASKPVVSEPAAKEPVEPSVEPKAPEPPVVAPKPAPEPPQAAAPPVEAPEPPKPAEPKPIQPPPKAAEAPPPVAAKPPEAKPAVAPKPPPVEAKPPEAKAPEPVAKSAPKPPEPKSVAKPAEPPQPVARAEPPKPPPAAPKVAVANPPAAEAVKKPPEAAPTETAEQREAKKRDAAIAAAIQRRSGAVQAGSGTAASDRDKQIAAAVQRHAQQVGSGAGSDAAAAGGPISVGPGSGAGGTPTDLQYILYQGKMDERIKAAWAWAGADKTLRAVIQFNLTPVGEIRNVRTIESSGDRQYDASCERAVRVSSPLDPVPEKYRELFATVEMTFKPTDVEH